MRLREIPGMDGYFASECGHVFSSRRGWAELSQWDNSSGYATVKVSNYPLTVHRAVALAWVDGFMDGLDVNHIDGDKSNNHRTNLEWCSRSDNIRHSLANGLHVNEETPVIGVNESTGDGVWAKSQAALTHLGFQQPNVNKCLRGERITHRGFKWRYAS
jgi:hypothetical protein